MTPTGTSALTLEVTINPAVCVHGPWTPLFAGGDKTGQDIVAGWACLPCGQQAFYNDGYNGPDPIR